ncbi:MAG TPA: DUF1778 domain-containing protein [Devosiaceae bacterium]
MNAATAEIDPQKDKKARRDTTMNVRLSTKLRDLIDSAADLVGKTRSEFVLESARQHAIDVLLDQRLFSLEEKEYEAFIKALDSPPEPPERLRSLFKERAPWEQSPQ